jgi:hypothetical protein
MRLLLLCAAFAACASANRVAHWPDRGSLVTIVNDTDEPVTVVAQADTRGGHVVAQRIWPRSRATFAWPWIDVDGQLVAARAGPQQPWTAHVFQPWTASYWCWYVSAPTVTRGRCAP